MIVFDRAALRRQQARRAADFTDFDFLHREIADRLTDRLKDINRSFGDTAVHSGMDRRFASEVADVLGGNGRVAPLLAPAVAGTGGVNGGGIGADEEILPLAEGSCDLIVSLLNLHTVNDLPGTLIQIRRALRPDGLFLAAIFGGETLNELRGSLLAAEAEVTGGASPRVAPFVDIRDAGGLLQRAGFALPVADADTVTVTYSDLFALMADLRGMGEAGVLAERLRRFTPKSVFIRAAEIYHERHADAEGRIPATFQIVYLHGWAPHESQQKPLRPGEGQTSLKDVLGN